MCLYWSVIVTKCSHKCSVFILGNQKAHCIRCPTDKLRPLLLAACHPWNQNDAFCNTWPKRNYLIWKIHIMSSNIMKKALYQGLYTIHPKMHEWLTHRLVLLWLEMKEFYPSLSGLLQWHWDNNMIPDSKVHGANMGPIWGRQDPGGPHVGPMDFAIWDCIVQTFFVLWFRYMQNDVPNYHAVIISHITTTHILKGFKF